MLPIHLFILLLIFFQFQTTPFNSKINRWLNCINVFLPVCNNLYYWYRLKSLCKTAKLAIYIDIQHWLVVWEIFYSLY